MIVCTKCKELKGFGDFSKDKYRKTGLTARCRKCLGRLKPKRQFISDEDRIKKKREYNKQYREKNKDRLTTLYSVWFFNLKNSSKYEEFKKNNSKRSGEWQERNKDKVRENSKNRTREIWKLKSGPCVDCGNRFHPCQMDFDHKEGTHKYKNVSALAGSKEKLQEEIKKCDLVCSNCHRLRTFNRKQTNDRK